MLSKLSSAISLSLLCAGASQAAIILNEVDLANNRVELLNTGASTESIGAWWWCNRVNGSPFYDQLQDVSVVDAGLSSPGATLGSFGAGQVLVLDITAGFLPDPNGELGLYTTNNFASSAAITDYIAWGGLGFRDNVADAAGLWTDNTFIDVTGIAAGETLQAIAGTEGNGPIEWVIGASTLGSTNVPEPASAMLGLLGLGFFLRRRR